MMLKRLPTLAEGAPLGPRGIAFLRRVSLGPSPYPLALNADRECVGRAIQCGFVIRDANDDHLVHITDAGRDHLGKLMRAA